MSKIANKTPAYCCSCFQARPDARHIDFEAAYDGPVIPGSPRVAIDDLILCESCLEEAFTLLDPKGQKGEIERLGAELDAARAEMKQKDDALVGYGLTTKELQGMAIERGRSRVPLQGVEGEAKKEVSRRLSGQTLEEREKRVRRKERELRKKEKETVK